MWSTAFCFPYIISSTNFSFFCHSFSICFAVTIYYFYFWPAQKNREPVALSEFSDMIYCTLIWQALQKNGTPLCSIQGMRNTSFGTRNCVLLPVLPAVDFLLGFNIWELNLEKCCFSNLASQVPQRLRIKCEKLKKLSE